MALMMSMIGLKFMRRTSKCNGFNSKKTLLTTTSTITVGYSQYTPLLGGGLERDIIGWNIIEEGEEYRLTLI